MSTYNLCLIHYGKNSELVVDHLHGLDTITDSTMSQQLNSPMYSDDIMWLYIKLSDTVLGITDNTSKYYYVRRTKGTLCMG
jgi:hypothetical protein